MANLLDITVSQYGPGYCAYLTDRVEESRSYGTGPTVAEALDNLGWFIIERVDDRIRDLGEAGIIDAETLEACLTDIDGLSYLPW